VIQHENVGRRAACQHVVSPPVADIVGPAVAPTIRCCGEPDDRPPTVDLSPLHCHPEHAGVRSVSHPSALCADLGLVQLRRRQDRIDEVAPSFGAKPRASVFASSRCLSAARRKSEAEFGIVLEQRVRPRWPAALLVLRPRRDREVAAIDRRATGAFATIMRSPNNCDSSFRYGSRRSRRRHRRTRTGVPDTAHRAHWRNRPGRDRSSAASGRIRCCAFRIPAAAACRAG